MEDPPSFVCNLSLLPFVLLFWKLDICTSHTETFQMIPNMYKTV